MREVGEIIGLLHDLGKASQEFKNFIDSAVGLLDPDQDDYVDVLKMKGKVDHSTAGAQILWRGLSGHGRERHLASEVLSLCIASHHSGIIDCISADGKDIFHRWMEKPEEKSHEREAFNNLFEGGREKVNRLINEKLVTQLSEKLINLKEENDSKETLMFKGGLLVRFLFSCLIDADRLSTADFEFPHNKELRNQNKYPSWRRMHFCRSCMLCWSTTFVRR